MSTEAKTEVNVDPKTVTTNGPKTMAPGKRRVFVILGVALILGAAWLVYQGWMYEETDNAYISGHLHYVSARVSGVVADVKVEDNQMVKEGDVLVTLDPADYQAQYDEMKAEMDKAQTDYNMVSQLAGTKAVSQQDLDHATNDLAAAKARLQQAQLQLDYTVIHAPASGIVGRKSVEIGNRIQPGQSLLVVVETDVWVLANFKETQLDGIKVGSPVELSVDAIPGKVFKGEVGSFAPASGNEFALLPADNATGNFTKIVQRVPVKILFDPESVKGYADRLQAGLSVIVRVKKH